MHAYMSRLKVFPDRSNLCLAAMSCELVRDGRALGPLLLHGRVPGEEAASLWFCSTTATAKTRQVVGVHSNIVHFLFDLTAVEFN
jgi:hypothetical protein